MGGLSAPAVLHANVAGGAHVKPSLKAILEGHRGDIKVIAQALKAEISYFVLHGVNLMCCSRKCKVEIAIEFNQGQQRLHHRGRDERLSRRIALL